MYAMDYAKLAMRTRCPQGQVVVNRLGLPANEEDTALLHGCIGLAGEAGELADNVVDWLNLGKELDRVNLSEELGDVFWYSAEICEAAGWRLELFLVSVEQPSYLSLIGRYLMFSSAVGGLSTVMQRWLYYGKGQDMDKLHHHLQHVLWGAKWIAEWANLDICQIMQANIAKLKERYPKKFTEELAAEENRDRAAERKVLEIDMSGAIGQTEGKADAEALGSHTVMVERQVRQLDDPNQEYTQTGAGWAQPPEDDNEENPYTKRETQRKSPEIPAHRAQLTDSYPVLCRLCRRVAVHKNNSLQICPDCMAGISGELRREEAAKAVNTRPEDVV